ncbi:MAG: hypothetical protein IPH06_09475 [Alphaproteobacteria bacterium]|jgi:dGTP triphosphohydrolase|nr:hypothetical protein [Alphaproteobacteria bacterium]QQS58225.1 MAG: hypothetical protein IPN28_05235 [Alphaproteobacteria bacterium]
MGAALALEDDVISPSDLDGVTDLLEYLEKPHSFGLDNMPVELRSMILMMLELQGYTYGYMQHQVHTFGHTSMLAEEPNSALAKKRRQEEFWIEFNKMLAQMESCFDTIHYNVHKRIHSVRAEIVSQVMAIDASIAAAAATPAMAEAMKATHAERGILKWMKRRLEKHETELAEANTAAEVVQVHQKMEQDLHDVKTGNVSPNRAVSRPSPLTRISEYVRRKAEMFPDVVPEATVRGESEDKGSSSGGKGKGGRGGKSGDSSSGSGAGEKEEITPPPPPLIGD